MTVNYLALSLVSLKPEGFLCIQLNVIVCVCRLEDKKEMTISENF